MSNPQRSFLPPQFLFSTPGEKKHTYFPGMPCRAFSTLWSNWGQRFQLVAFLLLGLIFAILHHLLGNFLSGKPFYQSVAYGRWTVPSQSLVSALNNVLSQIVKWLLASTIGVVFAQYFWSATKSYHDWRKLDAPLAAANGNPFTISALPTWYRSPGLAISALMMMSMIFIPIFVPGSIRVVTASGLMQPCIVDSPNISMTYLAVPEAYMVEGQPNCKATIHTAALVNRVIVGGSYLPVPNPCGVCVYQVKFTAASLKCSSDINGTYDFSANLPLSYKSGVPILNGTLTWSKSGYALTVATRDGVVSDMNPPVAVRCAAYRADYHVQVQHNNFSSQVDILNVTVGSPIGPVSPISYTQPSNTLEFALGGLVLAIGKAFSGSVIFDSPFNGFAETPLSVAYSPLLHWNRTNSRSILTMSDLTISLPRLMQNVSLSLLSMQFTPKNQTYMERVQTECSMTQMVYEYNPSRLRAIYATAWAAAAIFFSLGFFFVWKNGEEHNLAFSHVVEQRHLGSYSQVPLIPEGSGSWHDMHPLQLSNDESCDLPHS